MLISLIIPSFKPREYARDCIRSIAQQSLGKNHFEVILILNGTKQPYYTKLLSYIDKSTELLNITLLYEKKANVCKARNIGLKKARGKFIAFMDDDDVISPNYLKNLLEHASINGVTFSNALQFTNNIKKSYDFTLTQEFTKNLGREKLNILSFRKHMSFVWGKLFCANLIANFRFDERFVIGIGDDAVFMATISSKIENCNMSDNSCIYYWRKRDNSACHKRRETSFLIKNTLITSLEYIRLCFKSSNRRNVIFLISRPVALLKGTFLKLLRQ